MKALNKSVKRNCLDDKEIQALVQVILSGQTLRDLRRRVIVLLVALTNIQRDEIPAIRIRNLDGIDSLCTIEVPRRLGKDRLVRIPAVCRSAINDYVSARGLTSNDRDVYLITKDNPNIDYNKCNMMSAQSIKKIINEISAEVGINNIKYISPTYIDDVTFIRTYSGNIKLDTPLENSNKKLSKKPRKVNTRLFDGIINDSEAKKSINKSRGLDEKIEMLDGIDDDFFDNPIKLLKYIEEKCGE